MTYYEGLINNLIGTWLRARVRADRRFWMDIVGLTVNVYGYRSRTRQDEKSSAALWMGDVIRSICQSKKDLKKFQKR